MKEKELTLKEAEQIVDTMYENKFIDSGTIEGNNIHLGNMDNIEFTDLENASIYLLREEIRLKQELQRKDNIINELKNTLETCIYGIEPKGCSINYNCEYDSEEDYICAMQEQSRLNTYKFVLDKIKEIEGEVND